jgi:hypothetical protein
VRLAALLAIAVVGAGCGSQTAAAPRSEPPSRHAAHGGAALIASTGIGTITGDCSSGSYVRFTFRADYLSPTETVIATAGRQRMRADLDDRGAASITVPLQRRRWRPQHFDVLSPVVTWKVIQSHEPSSTRMRARLQVTTLQGPECLPTLTRLRLVSHSH